MVKRYQAKSPPGLARLNSLEPHELETELFQCCGSARWAKRVSDVRPYKTADDLYAAADRVWSHMGTFDRLEAISHHPRIGDPEVLKARFGTAAGEQSGVRGASDQVLSELAEANDAYERKFGHVFLVCATGKSAAEMLELLKSRMNNDKQAEEDIAAAEQAKITRLRLEKLVMSAPAKSPLTTHVLDTAAGRPAAGVPVVLESESGGAWKELARGATDQDGRAGGLLAGRSLEAGVYRLTFDTEAYFKTNGVSGFYPSVSVVFYVRHANEHYHVPLLLSPFGYSTYRGS